MSAFYAVSELAVLSERGIQVLQPELTSIRRDVDLNRIASGVVMHPFTRISGSETAIGANAELGLHGPVTLENSVVGPDSVIGAQGPVSLCDTWTGPRTVLGMGTAEQAVFLGREHGAAPPTAGVGFRVRKGSLYEEGACSAQHTDTKMTILLPWATLGSNLNFCDVLLAGGIGDQPGQFSEVGSGTIHFNFTIRGDKATASLLGDVVQGVFLRSDRLFIGGNNSLLGPLQGEYGAFSAAGARLGGSMSRGLNLGQPMPSGHVAYDARSFPQLRRVVHAQLRFLGELTALFHWYGQVRIPLLAYDESRSALYKQAQELVRRNIQERIAQLDVLTQLVRGGEVQSREALSEALLAYQRNWLEHWPALQAHLQSFADEAPEVPEVLARELSTASGNYTAVIQSLSDAAVQAGTDWLERIAQEIREGEQA